MSGARCPAGITLPGLGEALQSHWLPTYKLCHLPVAMSFCSEKGKSVG